MLNQGIDPEYRFHLEIVFFKNGVSYQQTNALIYWCFSPFFLDLTEAGTCEMWC